jgi:hypothetical protein
MNSEIYITIILHVVLYGCETWSLTLREERRLRMFENMVLRRRFGSKGDEVTGEWRKLHTEELNGLYSPNIIGVMKPRRKRWAGHVARMGSIKVHTVIWWGNLRERDHLEDPGVYGRIILECIFKKCSGGREWIDLALDRDCCWDFVNAVINLRVP